MSNDQIYHKLKQKMEEVSYLPPQNLGILTPYYKKLTSPLKREPWKIILPLSVFITFVWQILVGTLSIKIVSVLQAAF